jgi:hypothetical protein
MLNDSGGHMRTVQSGVYIAKGNMKKDTTP